MDMFTLSHSISENGNVPNQFKILPLGWVHSQKGEFLVDEESFESIQNEFKARNLEIPVDYEHQTLKSIEAPAAGWITNLALKADGIYADVQWTVRAAEFLRQREYRYCSPVIMTRVRDKKVMKLHSVALTNTPAIDAMTPIVNKAGAGTEVPVEDIQSTDAAMERLAALLELPEKARLEDIYKAVADLLSQGNSMFVELHSYKLDMQRQKADITVQQALKTGKISPAMKAWGMEYALKDPTGFDAYLNAAPQVVPLGEMEYADDLVQPNRMHTRTDDLMGLSADDVRRYGR